MKIFAMQIKCDTAEELSQALRMAADCVIATPGFFAAMPVDEWVSVDSEGLVELGRTE